MLVLVANLGSTSFKYRLFRMDESGGEVIAKGPGHEMQAKGIRQLVAI